MIQQLYISAATFPSLLKRVNATNHCPCPYLESLVWARNGSEQELRMRLLTGCSSLNRAIGAAYNPVTPLAMLYLPKCKAPYSHTSLSKALIEGSSGTWELFFLCEDLKASNSEKRIFTHDPISMPRNPSIFKEALPFLKCAVSCIMCEKILGPGLGNLIPYNVSDISRHFDFAALVSLVNYYDHYASMASNNAGAVGREKKDTKGPMLPSDCDDLLAAVMCLESCLVGLYTSDLYAASSKTKAIFDQMHGSWMADSGFEKIRIEKRTWWVSQAVFNNRWTSLMDMLKDNEEIMHLSPRVKEPVLELVSHITGELGIRDSALAADVAVRLTREGFESWDDVLRVREFIECENGNTRGGMMKLLVEKAGLPFAVAGKIVKRVESTP